ncbi:MAG TPA: undecaprenyl-diphosphate phosphatase [Bacillota bacterium]
MNDFFKAMVLGVVEGLTEFLPVSSTGHLILVNQLLPFDKHFTHVFDVVIQLGAILSVVVYFWGRLFPFSSGKTQAERKQIYDLWLKTLAGIIPMLLIGAVFKDHITEYLFNPVIVSLALVVWGGVLLLIENRHQTSRINSMAALDYRTAFLIGLIQCLAMIPGTSRSAATIVGAMLLGASRVVAAEFSFFLAIPTMVAASSYALLKTGFKMTGHELLILGTGFIVSFLVAWLVIAGFMKFIAKRNFKPFAYYRIILGIVILGFFGV